MKTETKNHYEGIVQRAVIDVAGGLDAALDLTALARRAGVSPLHFHRIFRGAIGETPLELHRRLRMERAAHELADGDRPVTRIAFDAGYETHESFTRAFKEQWGEAPSAFRASANTARVACAGSRRLELQARSGIHYRATGVVAWSMKGDSAMQVDIRELAEIRVFAVRHIGPYPDIGEAFGRLHAIAAQHGLAQRPGTQMIALYHDDPEATPADQLRADAGLSATPDASLPEGLGELRIPEGLYAVTIHRGVYAKLGDVWSAFMGDWLPKSGHRLGHGPTFEIYKNTPLTAPPEELETELYLPLSR